MGSNVRQQRLRIKSQVECWAEIFIVENLKKTVILKEVDCSQLRAPNLFRIHFYQLHVWCQVEILWLHRSHHRVWQKYIPIMTESKELYHRSIIWPHNKGLVLKERNKNRGQERIQEKGLTGSWRKMIGSRNCLIIQLCKFQGKSLKWTSKRNWIIKIPDLIIHSTKIQRKQRR